MAGERDSNLRSGDIKEDLGLLLLKGISAVAPVPRPEDVGLDAIATLLRRHDSRRLIAEDSFYVQLKSSAIRELRYEEDEVTWLANLKLPLFIGSVDLAASSISLFATHRLSTILLEHEYRQITLYLDEVNESGGGVHERKANLRPPLLVWSVSDLAKPGFAEQAYSVLKPYILAEQKNLLYRPIRYLEPIRWEANQPPRCHQDYMMFGSSTSRQLAQINLEAMKPHLRALLLDCMTRKARDEMAVILALIEVMRRQGVEPDPDNICAMLASIPGVWASPESSSEGSSPE